MSQNPLPIFPLGSVLLPGALLPLRVFEPRYLALLDAVADSAEFGSVLIERGSEVGGGDVRMNTGCVGQIIAQIPQGEFVEIAVVGTRRFHITQWGDDDPFPQAQVSYLPEPAATDADQIAMAELRQAWDELDVERVGLGAGPLRSLDDLANDAALFSYQLASVASIGPLDRYRVLQAETPAARLEVIAQLLSEQIEDVRQARRLGS